MRESESERERERGQAPVAFVGSHASLRNEFCLFTSNRARTTVHRQPPRRRPLRTLGLKHRAEIDLHGYVKVLLLLSLGFSLADAGRRTARPLVGGSPLVCHSGHGFPRGCCNRSFRPAGLAAGCAPLLFSLRCLTTSL